MSIRRLPLLAILCCISVVPTTALGALQPLGTPAPAFTKNVLNSNPWPTASLSQFSGRIVVLHILGWFCDVCKAEAPSVEVNVWQYYKNAWPGQVQVLGADVGDGTISQLNDFKAMTGVTYPLMRDCQGAATSPENFIRFYGERDHFVVINQQGIVRYNSALVWPYPQGYKLNEIRGCVDSLVNHSLGVEGDLPLAFALAALPNPARGMLTVTLASPRDLEASRVAVHDLAGRRVATLWDGPLRAGRRELLWDARDDAGTSVAPGVYMVLADAAGARFTRRVVVVH